jgi:hypothetical protein
MPTLSIHLPPATYKRLKAAMGRKQKPSTFGRALIERQLDLLPPKVTLGSMKNAFVLAPDFDPEAPAFPASDYEHGDTRP